MNSKERMLERLKTIAHLITADTTDDTLDDIRTMTRLFLNTMGQVRGEMVAGCYGEGDRIHPESLVSIMEEQMAIAQQAIAAAAFVMRIIRGDTEAQQY
jgi:hypothetical protein